MSRSAPLYALQQIDKEMAACHARLSVINDELGESGKLVASRARVSEIRDSLRIWRTRQRDQELQLQSVQQKRRASEQRLYGGKVRNPKELSDLQAEVRSLSRRQEDLEEAVFETMMAMEELEEAERGAVRELEQIELQWKENQAELVNEKAVLEARLAEFSEERQARITTVPASDMHTYEHLRDRKGGIAVAQLKGDECQGCMAAVSASRVKEARGNSLAYCGTCGRILYPTG